jgi:hypothetical protein
MLAVFHLHRDRRTLGTYVLDYDDEHLSCCIHHFFFPAAHKSNITASQGTKDKNLETPEPSATLFIGWSNTRYEVLCSSCYSTGNNS